MLDFPKQNLTHNLPSSLKILVHNILRWSLILFSFFFITIINYSIDFMMGKMNING